MEITRFSRFIGDSGSIDCIRFCLTIIGSVSEVIPTMRFMYLQKACNSGL